MGILLMHLNVGVLPPPYLEVVTGRGGRKLPSTPAELVQSHCVDDFMTQSQL